MNNLASIFFGILGVVFMQSALAGAFIEGAMTYGETIGAVTASTIFFALAMVAYRD
jgi:hypothetical protein